jgi:AcrR family transcriptional regulator
LERLIVETARSMRADARRNRDKLLVAATELFAEAGAGVSLDAVARRAGVGIGTLYRHFPTREALVEAAYRNEVEQLCAAGDELLRAHPPDIALAKWMDRFVDYVVAKRGLASALGSPMPTDARTRIERAAATLLGAGVAAGSIRADVDADDVLRAMSAIWPPNDDERWEQQARRLLGLLMDGLRSGSVR